MLQEHMEKCEPIWFFVASAPACGFVEQLACGFVDQLVDELQF